MYRRLIIEPSSFHFVECIFQGEKIGFKKKKVVCHEGKLVPYPIHDTIHAMGLGYFCLVMWGLQSGKMKVQLQTS